MTLTLTEWKDLTAGIQSVTTALSLGVGGVWVYLRYVRQQERYPNIEFSADVNFIGIQDGHWIAELTATVDNKGRAQHRMSEFLFDLNALESTDKVRTDDRWGGQVDFPKLVAKGSFLPGSYQYFFIDPGVKAKYSYVARIPVSSTFVILHCRFKYTDTRMVGHTAERTIAVPKESAATSALVLPGVQAKPA